MKEFSKFIGLDVHKETIAVSVAQAGGEVRYYGEIRNTAEALKDLVKRLRKEKERLTFCYEAGPCGYVVYRQLVELKEHCVVVAPSLIPKKAGDRVKTDRRDSVMLARLHRAGELTAVWVPDLGQEALRDLTRAREDMKHLERQGRQRLSAFLLRHGRRYPGKSRWTRTHFLWLETQKFASPVQQIVFEEYIQAIKDGQKRVQFLDKEIERAIAGSEWQPLVSGLMSLRGINLLTAVTLVAEIGDLQRFSNARQLMAYLGLVPSEYSSGQKQRRGGITKTGNGHARRVLVESAWCYRHPARKTATIQRRAEKTSEEVQAIAWSAQKRLCQRYRNLLARGKITVQVCTAVARELVGFIWAIGQLQPRRLANG